MKKRLLSILMVFALVFGSFSGVFVPASANAAEEDAPTFEKKSVETYLFSKDKSKKLDVLFQSDMPEEPYISIEDYLDIIYVDDFTETGSDGLYKIKDTSGATMTVDVKNDKISIDMFYSFLDHVLDYGSADSSDDSSDVQTNVLSQKYISTSYLEAPVEFDLSKYQINIVENSGNVYIPISTMNDMLIEKKIAGVYLTDKIYFYSTDDASSSKLYFESARIDSLNTLKNSDEFQKYYYNEFCFYVDNFYGCPSKAMISYFVREKGLDKALDTMDKITPLIKKKLLSTDRVDNLIGALALGLYFEDGGHSKIGYGYVLYAYKYRDTKLGKAFLDKLKNLDVNDPLELSAGMELAILSGESSPPGLEKIRETKLAKYDLLKKWDEGETLYAKGNIAILSFDNLSDSTVYMFNEALDLAKDKGIKKIIIDISNCTGGFASTAFYILTVLNNSKNGSHSHRFEYKYWNPVINNVFDSCYDSDLNLDGRIDEADDEVSYDFDFAVMSSEVTFSAANAISCYAKELGIPVIGEKSSGGSCFLLLNHFADFSFNYSAGTSLLLYSDGKTDLENGAPVDAKLVKTKKNGDKDYSNFYDIDLLSKTIDELKKTPNPMTVKVAKKTIMADALKRSDVTVKKAITVKKAKGKVTYKLKSGSSKGVSISKKGVITVKKGTYKKGKTLTAKVSVKAAGSTKYRALTKTVTVKIKVK